MTLEHQIQRIAIVGGGTAGWMAASVLAHELHGTGCAIHVVESPEIGTVGVGEATIPPILDLLRFLQIDQADFVKHTKATYKLGIKFHDWRRLGSSYWHPFGTFGATIDRRPFFHFWHKARTTGAAPGFNDFSLCAALGDEDKFLFPDAGMPGPVAGLRYALHFDAGLVAKYLRAYSERFGVERLEQKVVEVTRRADGLLDALVFADGTRLAADFFIDCSGFRGVLIEQALGTGYIDWSSFLPCDRAVAVPTEFKTARTPYTQAKARKAGWQWRIPLQHRAGNGYVYCSAHLGDDEAWADLQATVGEKTLAEPRFLRFTAGRRRLFWNRNCLALGLASGFLEPLESTSIHLVMSGLTKMLEHFPDKGFDQANIDLYNERVGSELERVRDFIILHYCTTERNDAPLWDYCRTMALPDTLAQRIELYRRTGRIMPGAHELFTDLSWFYIFDGMGLRPERYDPLVELSDFAKVKGFMTAHRQTVEAALRTAPSHDSYFGAVPAA